MTFQQVSTRYERPILALGTGAISSDGPSDFVMRTLIGCINNVTAYQGAQIAAKNQSLSSQEIIAWLREEGLPLAIIAEVMHVECKSVYAWLHGKSVRPKNQRRLQQIYSLFSDGKIAGLRQLYRFWNRDVINMKSLATMFREQILDEPSIRQALIELWPLAKREHDKEDRQPPISIKTNPLLLESSEIITFYDK